MRYSKAADTGQHTVMTLNKAMIRLGFLRQSDEARNSGCLRKRKQRSACCCPW